MRRHLGNLSTSEATGHGEGEFSQLTGLLVMRVAIAVPDWVRRSVERGVANAIVRVGPYWSIEPEKWQALDRGAELAGWEAAEEVEKKVSTLLAAVEDLRPVTPRVLDALQEAVIYPAGVLRDARIPKARRDRSAMKLFPNDVYNVAPRSLAELHPMMPELLASWEVARMTIFHARYGR